MITMTRQKTSKNLLLDHMYVLFDLQLLSSFFLDICGISCMKGDKEALQIIDDQPSKL
jgi:hypothetical protein